MTPLIPVAGGVLALLGGTGVLLRLKAKKAAPPIVPVAPSPIPSSKVVPAPAPAVTKALPPIVTNPDGSDHTQGTPFVFSTNADAAASVAKANALGISVHELLLREGGQLPTVLVDAPQVVGRQGVVTTNDPAPSGDLLIRTAPNDAAPTIPGGGADKGGTLTVIRDVDTIWAEVNWPGGRRPGGRGFAKKKFIKLV